MKKNLLLLGAAFLLAVGANAQVSYGVKAGVNLPKLKFTGDGTGTSYTTNAATNFHVTGYASLFAAPNFAIQPGLSLQGKGGKFKEDGMVEIDGEDSATLNFMSLEIPVNAVYYIPTGEAGSVFLGAGPYVGFNISGKGKSGGVSEDVDFGSGQEEFKRLDYGANFTAGYKLSNGFLVNAAYGLGLGNLTNIDGAKMRNQVLSFGVGFEF